LSAWPADAEARLLLAHLAPSSCLLAPLSVRGRTLGLLTMVRVETAVPYDADDLVLVQELARRTALTLENAELYRQVQEAVQRRDEFLSSVAHDLKSPLGTIRAGAQLLQRRALQAGTPDAKHLAAIEATVTRMARMVDELLDVARLQLGQPLELSRRPTDLAALAQRMAAEQQATARHRLQVEAPAPVVGCWDAVMLERVLANLLSNAVKYSPAGGDVLVTVSREADDATGERGDEETGSRTGLGAGADRADDGASQPSQAWAVLSVRDQGLGIPAEDVARIFERFHRGQNVRGRISGSGIGLAGVARIIERHGGTISVASQEGQGTVFTVRLPLDLAS
jgi:signal transduction histidine kinase